MAWLTPLNPPQTDWRGKSVWILGASSGIGRATASALHAQGAHVTVSARSTEALDAFVQAHPGSTALALDCTDRAAVHACAHDIRARALPDCVLYCAGHYQAMRASAMDVALQTGCCCRSRCYTAGIIDKRTKTIHCQLTYIIE